MSQALRDQFGNYHINGKSYKSITTVIREECPHMALDAWKERTPDWKTVGKRAALYGTMMHVQLQMQEPDIIPVDIPSEMPYWTWPDDMEDELAGRMTQWKSLNLVLEKPCLIEHTIVIERHDIEGDVQCAGTWDRWGKVDGMLTLLDWKSSKRPQKSHRIQMGAYYIGAKDAGIEVEWGMIPYVRKTSIEIVEMTPAEMQEEGEKFLELARKSYLKVNGKKN